MNKDVTEIGVSAQGAASLDAEYGREGAMPFAFLVLGALAFPLVLVTALASGLQLFLSGLVALTLSGPVALVLYLALALGNGRAS